MPEESDLISWSRAAVRDHERGKTLPARPPHSVFTPPDPAGIFSEGGEVIKRHTVGSLSIPTTEIKRL